MGENDTTRVSFICRKENSASDWDRYPATTSGTGQSSWLVIRTCLPKSPSSSAARASGSMLQVRRRSLGWSPPSCQVMTRRTQGLAVIVSISAVRSEEHTSELQSHHDLVCRLLLEKKKK